MDDEEVLRKNWHRYFDLILADFFVGSPIGVEVEYDVTTKSQYLDALLVKAGNFVGELPDGLDNMGAHNLITYKSRCETLHDWAMK